MFFELADDMSDDAGESLETEMLSQASRTLSGSERSNGSPGMNPTATPEHPFLHAKAQDECNQANSKVQSLPRNCLKKHQLQIPNLLNIYLRIWLLLVLVDDMAASILLRL